MASIKLGSLLANAKSALFGGGLPSHPKAMAQQLLTQNPLTIDPAKEPTAHLVKNPLGFTNIQFPRDLGVQNGMGHYIIFYSISNNKSIDLDKKFNDKIGVSIDREDIYGGYEGMEKVGKGAYKIKKLKSRAGGDEIQIGRSAPNSVLAGGLQTHSHVTGGVALYMPPGVKVSYGADTGHTELGLAGMGAKAISEAMGAKNTAGQVEAVLKGIGGGALSAARKLAVETGQALGLGDIDGAISKVTATAENNFSEAVFQKINERSFSYTFNLIARNKDEAQDIQKIIKFFKFHMHPELDENVGARYFRVPSEFEIHYAYNDQKNNYLHNISRCVCQGVDVDYGGDAYATFRQFDDEGAAPVNISLGLNFVETTILTKKEIADNY
jgi:hypothetical protein